MPLQTPFGGYYVLFEPGVTPNVSVTNTAGVNLASTTANTTHTLTSAATTNATNVKATAGRVYSIVLSNANAAARFFKLYARATAPTVGTDIPIATFEVAANSSRVIDFGPFGLQVATGISYAITGLIADSDTTAISAGDFKVVVSFV